eukprot:scaffold75905_cov48-Attheya_sp.AAC.3
MEKSCEKLAKANDDIFTHNMLHFSGTRRSRLSRSRQFYNVKERIDEGKGRGRDKLCCIHFLSLGKRHDLVFVVGQCRVVDVLESKKKKMRTRIELPFRRMLPENATIQGHGHHHKRHVKL